MQRRVPASLVAVALAVVATGCTAEPDTLRTDWWLAAPPDGAELELHVFIGSSSCNHLEGVEVVESAEQVELVATVRVDDDDVCTSDWRSVDVSVALDSALGDRALLGCRAPEGGQTAPGVRWIEGGDCRATVGGPFGPPAEP